MTVTRWVIASPAVLVLVLAVVGPWVMWGNATTPVAGPFQAASGGLVLGTDVLGRDVLARVLVGGRTLVLQAVAATVLGSLFGLGIGVWAGTTPHAGLARVVLRCVDAIAAVPALLLLLLLAAGVPGNNAVVAVVIAVVSIPFSVRVIWERTRLLAATDYAHDALARGERWGRRVRFDVLPGLTPVALSEAGIRFIAATQLAATAGFLGLGAGAPAANWGRMVRENSTGLSMNPLAVLVPAALLVILAVGITVLLDRSAETRIGGLGRMGRMA